MDCDSVDVSSCIGVDVSDVPVNEPDVVADDVVLGEAVSVVPVTVCDAVALLLCDAVVVLTAPPFVRDARVLARPGMSRARLKMIRARQMAERERCARADFVISTGLGRRRTFLGLKAIVRKIVYENRCRRPGAPF